MLKSDQNLRPLRRRELVGGLLAAAVLPSMAQAAPCRAPKVLFVCPSGTVKSAIAREVLRRRAAELGVPLTVSSRGIKPEDHVSPALALNLKADGIDPGREPVRAFTPGNVAASDIVIAFDEAAGAAGLEGARVWQTPSWNTDYPAARAATTRQVDGLLAELRGRPCAAASSPPPRVGAR